MWIQREKLKATLCFHTQVSVSLLIMKILFTRLTESYIGQVPDKCIVAIHLQFSLFLFHFHAHLKKGSPYSLLHNVSGCDRLCMLDYLARKAITAQQKNAMTARQHFSVNIDIIKHKLTSL